MKRTRFSAEQIVAVLKQAELEPRSRISSVISGLPSSPSTGGNGDMRGSNPNRSGSSNSCKRRTRSSSG